MNKGLKKSGFIVIALLVCLLMFIGCDEKSAEYTNTEGAIEVVGLQGANDSLTIDVEKIDSESQDINSEESDETYADDAKTNEESAVDEDNTSEDGTEQNDSEGAANEEETSEPDSSADTGKNVDLIFFMGQSNMAGYGGDASLAPAVSEDAGMEFRAVSDPTKLYPLKEPFGINENKAGGLDDSVSLGVKKGSLVSSFVNTYHANTGHKVVAVSASIGGMAMDLWLNGNRLNDCVGRITTSISWLQANGYTINHTYMVWYQGESDIGRMVPVSEYEGNFKKFMNAMMGAGVQQIFLIVPKRMGTAGDAICDFQEQICREDSHYTLGSTLPSDYADVSYTVDTIHYKQEVLNIFGEDAGKSAAAYTNSH